jgi:hypothetical protein
MDQSTDRLAVKGDAAAPQRFTAPHLVPLLCPRCSTPVPAAVEEVAWVCAQCAQGLVLDVEKGLGLLEVNYAAGIPAAGIPANQPGKPYWVVDGQVTLIRLAYSGGKRENDEAAQFWGAPRRFFVPAFDISLENLLSDATNRLLNPPALQAGPPALFSPVTLPPANIQPAAEFIVMAIEAGRKDKLKKVDFSLRLSAPVLWILS